MLHHFRVFLNAFARKLSSWTNLDSHYLEYLVSMEQHTKLFCELADVLVQRHLLPQISLS